MEHDVGRVSRLRGEALLNDVLRLLRRRVARGELVLEVGAHHLGDDGDADDGDDPEHEDEPPSVVAVPGQAAERSHGLGLARLGVSRSCWSGFGAVHAATSEYPYDSSLMSCTTEFPDGEYPLTSVHSLPVHGRAVSAVRAVGRRPGNADTRGEIIEAAKRVFAAKGYDGTSLRAVAREAGVDPALVHHYFDGKASLFVAAMALPFDPREVKAHAASAEHSGARTIESFLTMWDRAEDTGSSFASCVAAMAASTSVADAMREFVSERVWSVPAPQRR